MAKGCQRRHARYERDLGCMGILIRMLDFRQARSSPKLLADKRRWSKRTSISEHLRRKLDKLACSDENCPRNHDVSDRKDAHGMSKPSVKKLIEEEMCSAQGVTQSIVKEVEQAQFEIKQEVFEKNSPGKLRRARTKSCDGINVGKDAENLGLECRRNSGSNSGRRTGSLDLDDMMERFFNIKSESGVQHDTPDEVISQLKSTNCDFPDPLNGVINYVMRQKIADRKDLSETDGYSASKDAMEALQVLSSEEEESFSKHSKYQDSPLSEDVQKAGVEKEKGPNVLEKEQSVGFDTAPLVRKQHSFFRRKAKSDPLDGKNTSKIVILKPGPKGLRTPESTNSLDPSTNDGFVVPNKEQKAGMSSRFFFTEIKRKWKKTMRREQTVVNHEQKKYGGNEQEVLGHIGRNSVTKDHFFIERIARPSNSVKKVDKTCKLKDMETSSDYPKQLASNIYVEAKKHLSNVLKNREKGRDLLSKQVTKSLGRILSLPEYYSSINNLGKTPEHIIVTEKMEDLDNVKENNTTCVGEETDDKLRPLDVVPAKLSQCEKSDEIHTTEEEMNYEDKTDLRKETETIKWEESDDMEHSTFSITRSDHRNDIIPENEAIPEVHHEMSDSDCLQKDFPHEIQLQPSPAGSPLNSLKENLLQQPSPVSVLEPLFTEDEISPPSKKSNSASAERRMQPLRIWFQDLNSRNANQGNDAKMCTDKELVYEKVKTVLKDYGLTWGELYMKSLSSDWLLETSLIVDASAVFQPIFDCINEVLMEICGYQFGCSPWVSFVKPKVWPIPDMDFMTNEVQEGVYWHFLPLPSPHTLDQIVRKDFAKSGMWMDCRFETECIGFSIGEAILDELMEEMLEIWEYSNKKSEEHMLSPDIKEGGKCIYS